MLRLAPSRHPLALLDELLRIPVATPAAPRAPFELYSHDGGWIVRAPLPGLDPESLDVSLAQGVLRVRAKRAGGEADAAERADDGRTLIRELARGDVDMTLRLGFRPAVSKVSASYERGVLTIELPLSEDERARRIPIANA